MAAPAHHANHEPEFTHSALPYLLFTFVLPGAAIVLLALTA